MDGLGEEEKRLASELLLGTSARFFHAGFRGRTPDLTHARALVVESGFVVVHASVPSARQVVVAEAGPGSIVLPPRDGEHLHALTDSWVTVLPLDLLERLLAIPSVATGLFRSLGTALRLRQDATRYYGSVRHVDRVREKLLQLAQEFGKVDLDGIRLDFPVTHDLLAEMVASARETVTRSLDELERSGLLVRDGHSYRLRVSPEELDHPDTDPFGGHDG
ncbi:MAG TPA: Crp/Fnr family transcriptional regulator [Gaiellaceae bacterium]|nr:Crp/Fnr family transcriptional regulator [Gaiellaceae bacterium]